MAYPQNITWNILDGLGYQPITETSTTQKHQLGLTVKARSDTYGVGTFVYLVGVASTAAGDLCAYDLATGSTTRAVAGTAASNGPLGVAMSANVASQYGWYQVEGSAPVKSGTVAANGYLYLTSTAGQVDDVINVGAQVQGAIAKVASATGVSAWAEGTHYAVGALVTNDSGKVYRCGVAGQSARPWTASTYYRLGEQVTNDSGKLYTCDTTGTSAAATGPTGTDANQTDGTAGWDYTAAAGGPSGTSSPVRDGSVLWNYHLSAANNQAFTVAELSRPSVVGSEAGTHATNRIDLSAAAEDSNAIVVTGTVKTQAGAAISAAVQVVVRSLAVTADAGDITVTAGTEKKTVNPAAGENVSWIETTAAGGFAVSIANTNVEVTLVSVTSDDCLPANLKLTFA